MPMSMARRLKEAVHCWLHYEFCCMRAGLLSEGSLKACVGEVLSTISETPKGARVYADYAEPAIQTHGKRGRKPCVDFAIVTKKDFDLPDESRIFVETKWAGSSHCNGGNILRDIIRLMIIKNIYPKSKCIFLLAGNIKKIEHLFKSYPFNQNGQRGCIKIGHSEGKLSLESLQTKSPAIYEKSIINLPKIGFQEASTVCFIDSPLNKNNEYDFTAVAWEIKKIL